ncbi:laccase-7-like [Glycine soja]|uniref:Laccase n=1 Tax=Glycine soja TaxID=3848 RepID=A0A0B2PUW3_GLYSO|nr:laccase-7-like [Glycine soja]KHN12945.1 Laccase-7 [Glycine soja]RZC29397.1 Laccase-7 [Glycine soja]
MKRLVFSLAWAFALLLACSLVSGAVVEHTFNIGNLTVSRLCNEEVITTVNGSLPGPTIYVEEGDTLVVHANNNSPYNITLHWHGIFQILTAWADGPESVTQCPIRPGGKYTYRFNITGQEGTLWWHSHSSFLRATVYGALIIRPRRGNSHPFPSVYQEVPILLGEWWNGNVVDVENNAIETGIGPNLSDAYTINGLPGDTYNCSQNQTYQLQVKHGETYLLRIINAALNAQHFFKIANHTFTVVAIDASYTQPYNTDVIILAPGQTVDAIITTNQTLGSYYMAFTPYHSAPGVSINNNITRGVVIYENATSASPVMPDLPAQTDTPTAHKFYTNITGLAGGPHWVPVSLNVDQHMLITFGIGLDHCPELDPEGCGGRNFRLSASMNNESFVLPKGLSMMEAFFRNVSGVYTRDFPDNPPFVFNYTDPTLETNGTDIAFAPKSTKVKPLTFNSTVQVVLQNTAILARENHPIHLHSFNFHVLAQGFGNYDSNVDESKFNLDNPQIRNTISVPVGGWAVIRFQANNPGIWLVHCHLETHLPWGLAMAFEVENGPEPWVLPPPPADLPQC